MYIYVFYNLIYISISICSIQMGIVFPYLQIDAMLKQLHINRDCKCSGLLICNQLSVNICIILRDLSIINPGWGGALGARRVCHSLECEFIYSNSFKEGSS